MAVIIEDRCAFSVGTVKVPRRPALQQKILRDKTHSGALLRNPIAHLTAFFRTRSSPGLAICARCSPSSGPANNSFTGKRSRQDSPGTILEKELQRQLPDPGLRSLLNGAEVVRRTKLLEVRKRG